MAVITHITTADGRSFHKLNQALLTLLPKQDGATDIADFRPISLVHDTSILHHVFLLLLIMF